MSAMWAVSSGCHSKAVPPVLTAAGKTSVRALFCMYGGVGLTPVPLPPGYELQFAVAVVQIDSPGAVANVEVSDFALFDIGNKVTRLKRVVQVEVFDRPHVATGGSFADYLNAGGTQVLERNSARGADPPPCAGRTHRRTHCSGAIPAYGRPEGH